MDWHRRFLQQAGWTRELRRYLLARAGVSAARRILEVGCGTGVILHDLTEAGRGRVHGLDLSPAAVGASRKNAPSAQLCNADGHFLPYASGTFDIACCHFLLLWVKDPSQVIREMRRVTRRAGYVIAFAEPDYSARDYRPASLALLGDLQVRSLTRQGGRTDIGSSLALLFKENALHLIETGSMGAQRGRALDRHALALELEVLREDLHPVVAPEELDRLIRFEYDDSKQERRLHVPTYFALAQV
jgi:SAM-dependent methyltransferase